MIRQKLTLDRERETVEIIGKKLELRRFGKFDTLKEHIKSRKAAIDRGVKGINNTKKQKNKDDEVETKYSNLQWAMISNFLHRETEGEGVKR